MVAHMTSASKVSTAGVRFQNLSVTLGGIEVLQGITASVPAGGSTAIVGPNGAGKTTLINAILGEVPYTGSITLSLPGSPRRPRVGFVPQRLDFDRNLPLTVEEFMVLGAQGKPLWLGRKTSAVNRARECLAAVNAGRLVGRSLGQLSGGELQRVLLALAIQQRPNLLVLDEPASGVDVEGEQVICELLERLRARFGFTQLMVSHDLGTVSHHADHVICLNQGLVAEGTPEQVFVPETLSALFGIHMGLIDQAYMPAVHDHSHCGDDDD